MFYQENMYFILFSKFSNVSKCSSGWYYFHILYWISAKVTEYLNVSWSRLLSFSWDEAARLPLADSGLGAPWLTNQKRDSGESLHPRRVSLSPLILHARPARLPGLLLLLIQVCEAQGSQVLQDQRHDMNAQFSRKDFSAVQRSWCMSWYLSNCSSSQSQLQLFLNNEIQNTTDLASKPAVPVSRLGEVSSVSFLGCITAYRNEIIT